MPQAFSAILLHIIFSTKGRAPLIDAETAPRLHAYVAKVCNEMSCHSTVVGGMSDHIHVHCSLSRTASVCGLVEEIKRRSSRWMKAHGNGSADFEWQTGYAVFSVGRSNQGELVRYIENQAKHHRRRSFREELLRFMRRYGIEPDEAHMWD